MTAASERTTCAIAGGGPAGVMLGFLLARAGVDVTVLEKHADFLRDFRGDTIHTSTIELMDELGLAERFLRLPHEKAYELAADVGGTRLRICDFTALKGKYPFIAFMPQWDFLDFVAAEARKYPTFRIEMRAEVAGVAQADGRVTGLRYRQGGAEHEIRADLTVACDGRDSTLRRDLGMTARAFGAPMDVMWFALPREEADPAATGARIERGHMLVTIDRGDYWQMAYVVPKGTAEAVRADGLDAFRGRIADMLPTMARGRVDALAGMDEVKTLVVEVNRLKRWHAPGILFIGDAAHAMSPIGGVGINLAIQDAVAAANILAGPLAAGAVREADLARVQARRRLPTALTQALQRIAQRRIIGAALSGTRAPRPPAWLPGLLRLGPVRRAVANLIGRGLRPEHIAR